MSYLRCTNINNKKYTGKERKLWELENKLENGFLIEFPRVVTVENEDKYVLEYVDSNNCISHKNYYNEKDAVEALETMQRDEIAAAWDIIGELT